MIDWKWSILYPVKTIEIPYFENHVVLSFQRWLKVNFALQKRKRGWILIFGELNPT